MYLNSFVKLFVFFLFFYSLDSSAQTIRYVKQTATGMADGSSWANASGDPQEMLNISVSGDEIWVAAGTYKPTQDPFGTFNPVDPRNKTFYLRNHVKLYGGFTGNETSLSQRNWTTNPTILSGDFNGDDVITGSGGTLSITGNDENAYHVVLSIKDSSSTVLDGFIIKGGKTSWLSSNYVMVDGKSVYTSSGAGCHNNYSSPSIINCTFIGNANPGSYGCAIYNLYAFDYYTAIIISNCKFQNNVGVYGTGIDNQGNTLSNTTHLVISNCEFSNNRGVSVSNSSSSSNVVIEKCLFIDNVEGAAIDNSSNLIIRNSIFLRNIAQGQSGGAILNQEYLSTDNCLFIGNSAVKGGAIYNESYSVITNCTFTQNVGNNNFGGAAIYNVTNSSSDIKNSIIWGNTSTGGTPSLYNENATSTINYTTIEWPTIYAGVGNKKIDPLFTDPTDLDGIDNVWRTADDGLSLQSTSPAINVGTNTNAPITDITGGFRVGNPDMGAYEFGALTDINDFSQDITFKIYPNPTQDVLFIQTIDNRFPLYLYDLQGRLVRSSPFTPTEVDMKDLPTGMYFLKIDKITVKIHKIQ